MKSPSLERTALYNTGISEIQSCSSLSACHVRAPSWMVFIHYLRSKYEREALPRVDTLGNWGLERWGSLLKFSGSSHTRSLSQVRMQTAHEPSISLCISPYSTPPTSTPGETLVLPADVTAASSLHTSSHRACPFPHTLKLWQFSEPPYTAFWKTKASVCDSVPVLCSEEPLERLSSEVVLCVILSLTGRGHEGPVSSPELLAVRKEISYFSQCRPGRGGQASGCPEGLGTCLACSQWPGCMHPALLLWAVRAQAGTGHLGIMHIRSALGDLGTLQRQVHLWAGSHSCPSWSTAPASWCVLTWLPAAVVTAIHADRKSARCLHQERRKLSLCPGLVSLLGREGLALPREDGPDWRPRYFSGDDR